MPSDQRREAIVLPAPASRHDGAHDRHVGMLKAASERVGQQHLRSSVRANCSGRLTIADGSPAGPLTSVPSQSVLDALDAQAAVGRRASGRSPSKFSSARPIGIHQLVTAGARWILPVLFHPLAHRQRLARLLVERRHVGRRSAAACRECWSARIYRASPETCGCAYEFSVEDAAVPSKALARPRRATATAAELVAVNASGCRSDAPGARSRTCSRPSAGRATLRSSRTTLSKSSSVSRCSACRRLSSKSGKTSSSGRRLFRLREIQPLAREVAAERARALVGEHPLDLLFEHGWIPQLALRSPGRAADRRGCCSR